MAREYMRCARRAAVGFMATAPWCTRPWESGSAGARGLRRGGGDRGKKFYIAGLNLTSDKKPFGKMGDLMCIADNIKMMTSICEICKNDNAVFSYFKGKKDQDIVIGDGEYIPVCRKCYEKMKKEER